MDIIIASVLSLIVGIVIAKYAFFSNRVHELNVKVATLTAAKSELENRIANNSSEKAELQKQVLDCEKNLSELKLKLVQYEDKKAILAKYTKHEFGYYVHNETQKPFCPKCLQNFNPPRENQLTESKQYIDCESCDYSYVKNPANLSDLSGNISNLHRTDDI